MSTDCHCYIHFVIACFTTVKLLVTVIMAAVFRAVVRPASLCGIKLRFQVGMLRLRSMLDGPVV